MYLARSSLIEKERLTQSVLNVERNDCVICNLNDEVLSWKTIKECSSSWIGYDTIGIVEEEEQWELRDQEKKGMIEMDASHIDSKQHTTIYTHEIITLLHKILKLTKLTNWKLLHRI